jgi:hypothetical protein
MAGGVTTIGRNLSIVENDALCQSEVDTFVTDLGAGLGGTSTARQNNGACP